MKCLYCQSECEMIWWDDLTAHPIEAWKCSHCPHQTTYVFDVELQSLQLTSMEVMLKDGKYSVQFLHSSKECCIKSLFSPGKLYFSKQVLRLPLFPNLTPFNIAEKLPTILTFS